ncbi:MAG: elongation factor 1-beta [Candidatus Nanoarchaeia archaeon]
MADVIVKLKVMPASPEADLSLLQRQIEAKINAFGAKHIHSVTKEPIAFGLQALIFTFLLDETKSNLEALEEDIKNLSEIQSVEVIDVRRAIG